MIEPQVVLDKLGALGTATDIAEFLEQEAITGTHHSQTCPVANYVLRETGTPISICQSFWGPANAANWERSSHTVPVSVTAFIRRFDGRGFPRLEEPIA